MSEDSGIASGRLSGLIYRTACAFLSLVIASYAGLIAIGRWQLDEYYEFFHMRTEGAFLTRRLSWSPRPFSEVLYCSYGWLVNHFRHQFVVPMLGLLWLGFLVSGLWTWWQARRRGESGGLQLLIALAVMALSLAGGSTTDVFYWPAGAVAYIPTFAATLLLFLQVIDGRLDTRQGRLIASICLLIAAGSSETGATFVICYAFVQIAVRVIATVRKREQAKGRPVLWFAMPLVLAMAVVIIVRMNRYNSAEAGADSMANAGHPFKSLMHGALELVIETIGRPMLFDTYRLKPNLGSWLHSGIWFLLHILVNSRLAMQVMLVAAVLLLWSSIRRPLAEHAGEVGQIVTALLASSLFTAAAAYLHFGIECCHRHELVRQDWMVMILTGVAIMFAAKLSDRHRAWLAKFSVWAPLLLCAAALSLGYFPRLVRTYEHLPALVEANSENMASGFQTSSDGMTFLLPPSTGIVDAQDIPPGAFKRSAVINGWGTDLFPDYLLGFFDKQQIVIRRLVLEEKQGVQSQGH